MPPEKFLGLIFRPVGQQRDAEKVFLTRELDRVVEQLRTITVRLILFMNHQIFEQDHEIAFGRADGKKQINHANNRAVDVCSGFTSMARLYVSLQMCLQLYVSTVVYIWMYQ